MYVVLGPTRGGASVHTRPPGAPRDALLVSANLSSPLTPRGGGLVSH